MKQPETVYDVLVLARKKIRKEKRWNKGSMQGQDGSFCLVGAVSHVASGGGSCYTSLHPTYPYHELAVDTEQELASTLGLMGSRWYLGVSLADFNDKSSTQHADVLDLIDRTIARLEAPPL